MRIDLNYFKDGKRKALTLSYDDGRVQDRRLVEIMNRHGIRGTFHLNSGMLDREAYLACSEVPQLFKGHEVSAHTYSHPSLIEISDGRMAKEIMEDRKILESLVGYPVRGMSYPFGTYNEHVVAALSYMGIEYSRTVNSHGGFRIPENFLTWHPTCHHNHNLLSKCKEFISLESWRALPLFYVWGHSYEFDNDHNWEMIEEFCKMAGEEEDVWYATNIEILDYVKALRSLKWSVDERMVSNQAACSVWIGVDNKPVEVKPGQILKLQG